MRLIDDVYWLTDVYVHPDFRNLGIGSSIIRHAMEKKVKMSLHVEPHLLKFYEKFGFEKEFASAMKGMNGKEFEYYKMNYLMNDDMQFLMYIILTVACVGTVAILIILFK